MSPQAGWNAPTSSMTRSNGPSRSRIVAYSAVSPVSPLKNTACRGERITSDDHSVALRSFRPRPEKCCDGAAVIVSSAVGSAMRLPPVELGDALGRTPQASRCAPTPSDVTNGTSRLRQLADRRVVEVVVVVVRDDHHVERRQRAQAHRHGLEALRARRTATASARSPHRIGEHAQAVDLDQHRRVAEPGGAQPACRALAPRPRADRATATGRAAPAARRRRESRSRSAVALRGRATRPGSDAGCEIHHRSTAVKLSFAPVAGLLLSCRVTSQDAPGFNVPARRSAPGDSAASSPPIEARHCPRAASSPAARQIGRFNRIRVGARNVPVSHRRALRAAAQASGVPVDRLDQSMREPAAPDV